MSIGEAGRHPLAPGDTDSVATGDVVVIEGLAALEPPEGADGNEKIGGEWPVSGVPRSQADSETTQDTAAAPTHHRPFTNPA